jgi:hypothetical protein
MKMNVNWDFVGNIVSIVGSIVVLIGAVYSFIKWLKGYIGRKKLKGLKGTWHEYHWTNPDGANTKFKWLDSELKAKSGFFSSYKLEYTNNKIPFRGTARYIDKRDDELSGDILLKVQRKDNPSISKKETIYFRYNIPERQIGNNKEIAGIWLSYNFGKNITSGASILSEEEIPLNELNVKFEEYFEINNASIIVKRNDINNKSISRGNKQFLEPIKEFFTKKTAIMQ